MSRQLTVYLQFFLYVAECIGRLNFAKYRQILRRNGHTPKTGNQTAKLSSIIVLSCNKLSTNYSLTTGCGTSNLERASKYGKLSISQDTCYVRDRNFLTIYGHRDNLLNYIVGYLYSHRTEDYLDFHKSSPWLIPLIEKNTLLNCHTKVDLTVVRVIY